MVDPIETGTILVDTSTIDFTYDAVAPSITADVKDGSITVAKLATDSVAAINAKLDSSAYTAADVLVKIKTVDGTGSGLDSDLLDGQEGTYYLSRANHTGSQTAATISDFSTAADARIAAAIGTTVQAQIAAGTTAQYWRGDKSWQTLDVTAVSGLQTALDAKGGLATTNTWTQAQTFDAIPVIGGGGIKFPATQVPSADANTLDDYEEGTFTPALTFGGGNTGWGFSIQSGRYTKVGRVVYFEALVGVNAVGSSTGVCNLTGLPFTAAAAPQAPVISDYVNMAAGVVAMPTARVQNGTTVVNLRNFNGTTTSQINHTAFTASSAVTVAGHYVVA